MSNVLLKHVHGDYTSVEFNIEADEVMAIGEKMQAINEQAYMNGYNWEAFFNYYLATNHPELLEGLETDSEAGAYVALYETEHSVKADSLIEVINGLVKNPEDILDFLTENGDDVEWD